MKARRFGMVGVGLLAIAAFSAVTMLLWNALIPGIFGLTAINFWQALGLLVLTRLLFGGLGRMMMGSGMKMFGMHGHNPLREKWMNMSADERKEFIHRRHEHFHGSPFDRRGFFERGQEPSSEE